ncbi:MAG: carbohydrate kinase family protein [Deltaproteobacteria bacterium]|nr:carbohydrate kinase family protein [Deltaproteobacteria bacterium]
MNIQIVGVGALNIDHIYKVARILDDGEAVVEAVEVFPGGSAANTIYGLGKLGVSAGFGGAVGDDDEGKILLKDFEAVGVDTGQIKIKPKATTGSVICLSDKVGKRSLYVLPGANNLLTIKDIDLSYINGAKILHLSSFANDKQFKMSLELVDKLDDSVRLSFTPGALYAAKGFQALAPILRRTYILFINQDEIKQLTGEGVIGGAAECLQTGCQRVVVTLGKGIKLKNTAASGYIRDANNEYIIKPSDTGARTDTTGAGDAFAAGFLYGVVNNKDLEECGRLGDITAKLCISKIGAREGLPTLKELTRRYRQLYNK